jgi:hypothetical protein
MKLKVRLGFEVLTAAFVESSVLHLARRPYIPEDRSLQEVRLSVGFQWHNFRSKFRETDPSVCSRLRK